MPDLDEELDTALQALKDRYGEGLATESPSIARLLPGHLRNFYVERCKAIAEARGPMVYESGPNGVRAYRSPADADVDAVLLQARAVLKLDNERWELQVRVSALTSLLAQERDARASTEDRWRKLFGQMAAVKALHREADAPSCGDGCCHEPLGWCQFCGSDVPYPCKTYRVADGEREPIAAEDEEEEDPDA